MPAIRITKRTRRGGWRQAGKAAVNADMRKVQQPPSTSVSANGSLMEWCLGQLSGPRLKRNLRRQVMDNDAVGNYIHPLLVRLAKAGGSNSQNIHRSLMKLLVDEGFKQLVVEVGGAHIKYMVPPHRLIHSLSKTFPAKAQATLGLDSDLLFRFWGQPSQHR